MLYNMEELEMIICAANIAGYKECAGKIAINDDEELTKFILCQMEEYNSDLDAESWHDYINRKFDEQFEAD